MPARPGSQDRPPALRLLTEGSRTDAAEPGAGTHILLVVDGFPRSLGGGERVVLRLAALLPHYGFRVSILTFFIDPASSFRPETCPCPLYLLPLRKTYDLEALRGALALRRLLREQHVALVQTFFESSDLWAGLVTRCLSSARLIWSRRDMGILRGRKHAAAYRLLRRLPHGVHAVSEQVRRHAIEVDGIAAERTFTVHNGLDLQAIPNVDRSGRRGTPVVLTIGNIRRVKGHDTYIRAAAMVRDRFPDVRFLLAGEVLEKAYFEELRTLVGALGLEQHFHFLGGVEDLPAQLHTADIFTLPSRSEGFSNSLIEAMASGLPVVATTVGGNAEAIQQGVTGLLVAPDDPGGLAEALLGLLMAPADRLKMGQAGRQRVESEFTADAMVRRLARAYREILGTT